MRKNRPLKCRLATTKSYAHHLTINNLNNTVFNTNHKTLHICKKGRHIDALEEFKIYKPLTTTTDAID